MIVTTMNIPTPNPGCGTVKLRLAISLDMGGRRSGPVNKIQPTRPSFRQPDLWEEHGWRDSETTPLGPGDTNKEMNIQLAQNCCLSVRAMQNFFLPSFFRASLRISSRVQFVPKNNNGTQPFSALLIPPNEGTKAIFVPKYTLQKYDLKE